MTAAQTPVETVAAAFQIAWDDAVLAHAPDAPALDEEQTMRFIRDVVAITLRAALPQHRYDIARVMYEAQGYEAWGTAHAEAGRVDAAYRTADAVLAYLGGEAS